jgi:hypothetical protein
MNKSFLDEDWSGLTHQQIYTQIVAEVEERCNADKERKHTAIFLLILHAVINEQVAIKQLKKEVGTYIYEAVKEQAHKLGWID